MAYFDFCATAEPSSVNLCLDILPFSFDYWLSLLQTDPVESSTGSASSVSVTRLLAYITPKHLSASSAPYVAAICSNTDDLDPVALSHITTTYISNDIHDYEPD